MFADFENMKQSLGVLSYGVSITTMEDVFIKLVIRRGSYNIY